MTLCEDAFHDLTTPTGAMRTHLFRPPGEGSLPGVIFYSEIFQVTEPIRRLAAFVASHGFLVAVPEIFHEYEPLGKVLDYDAAGTDRGNWCKVNKPLAAYDTDSDAVVDFLMQHPACTGAVGTMGVCIGGHLAFRTALNPAVRAAVCFYPTDIHKIASHPRGLGLGMADDSLERTRAGGITGELLMVWGRQDPHIPFEGRQQIHEALEESGVAYQWLEFNAAHAFLRDQGPRYNPVLARQSLGISIDLLQRRLQVVTAFKRG
jgi:carboxymethylenebutenolidase